MSRRNDGFGRAARLLTYLVYAFVLVGLTILGFGFFLLLFGANADASFAEWIYRGLARIMAAGIRPVDILPALRDELLTHRHANANAALDALVFPTSSGSRRDKDNARERVIRPVVAHADELLADRGHEPLPAGVTAHKLRPARLDPVRARRVTRPM